MSRRNVFLLILAAVALTAFSIALSRRDSRDWRATRARRVVPFPWQDAVAVDIRRQGGETLVIHKADNGEWRLERDGGADTLSPRVAEELAAFATLAWKSPLPDTAAPGDDAAATIVFASSSGQSVSIVLGVDDGVVRVAETEGEPGHVYGIAADLADFLYLPAERFRSMYLASSGGRKPERIVVSPPGPDAVKVVLQRREADWEILEPVAWPADREKVETLLQWLDRLRADTVAAETPESLDEYGFTPESPFIELHYAAPEAGRRVVFGGEAPSGQRFVQAAGRTPVFSIPRTALAEIAFFPADQRPDYWAHHYRGRTLDITGNRPPTGVVVEQLLPRRVKLTLAAAADGDGESWRATLEEGGAIREFAVDSPSPDFDTPLGELLRGLSQFQVKTFLDDSPPGTETLKWTAYPAWRFTCRDADGVDGPVLTIYADDAEGKLPTGTPFVPGRLQANAPAEGVGLVCSVSGRDAIMEAFGYFSNLLCLPPYRYHTTKIIDADAETWEKVTIEVAEKKLDYFRNPDDVNEQWWRGGMPPRPLLDDNNRFVALLKEVAQLRSEGFVEDADGDIGDFGLDRPALKAIVYVSSRQGGTGDGPAFALSLGDVDASGGRYARLDGAGPVFVVSAALAEALEKEYR